jgi:hypothetical protein
VTAIALPHTPRRAVRTLALTAVVAGLAGTAVSLMRGAPPPEQVAADTVLAGEPHMGVACARPTWNHCDRVELELALRRPALKVGAAIAGRPMRLAGSHSGTRFSGVLEPAGIRERLHVTPRSGEQYWGIEPPSPVVELRIDYGDRVAVTALHVRLMQQWD